MIYFPFIANCSAGSEWKVVTRNTKIPADIQRQQLQVKTGSNNDIFIFFYKSHYELAGGISVTLSTPATYWITFCNSTDYYFPVAPSVTVAEENVWGFQRTESGVKIECNGELVLERDIIPSNCDDSSASDFWEREVMFVEFASLDKASSQYRLVKSGMS